MPNWRARKDRGTPLSGVRTSDPLVRREQEESEWIGLEKQRVSTIVDNIWHIDMSKIYY